MAEDMRVKEAVKEYVNKKHIFQIFLNSVVDSFRFEPTLIEYSKPILHTIKSRLKDDSHLEKKLIRKYSIESPITKDNIFEKITDLAGVRVLHLYQDQLPIIHEFIIKKVDTGDWSLHEDPIAYSWDPESQKFFESLNLKVQIKESYYTSIHYVVTPPNDKSVKCEIQVRTLFEEIWGEIDHTINYPEESTSQATKEQLRVLSKLVSTGTRLADSIFRLDKIDSKQSDP